MAVATGTALLIGGLASAGVAAAQQSSQRKAAQAQQNLLSPSVGSVNQGAIDAKAQADATRKALERTQTVFTSPLGLSDNALKTSRKKLLGQ